MKLTVGPGEGQPSTRCDSAVIPWPPTLNATPLSHGGIASCLRGVAEHLAETEGERLHHAESVITSDPADVPRLVVCDTCPPCKTSVAEAVSYLRGTPGREVAVLTLWWVSRDRRSGPTRPGGKTWKVR
jgi:hypothetical protein